MSQTMNVSVLDAGVPIRQPEYLMPSGLGQIVAYTDFFDWEAGGQAAELAEDLADARQTRDLYEVAGIQAFVRVR